MARSSGTAASIVSRNWRNSMARCRRCRSLMTVPLLASRRRSRARCARAAPTLGRSSVAGSTVPGWCAPQSSTLPGSSVVLDACAFSFLQRERFRRPDCSIDFWDGTLGQAILKQCELLTKTWKLSASGQGSGVNPGVGAFWIPGDNHPRQRPPPADHPNRNLRRARRRPPRTPTRRS